MFVVMYLRSAETLIRRFVPQDSPPSDLVLAWSRPPQIFWDSQLF